jgi:urocanate hydratase
MQLLAETDLKSIFKEDFSRPLPHPLPAPTLRGPGKHAPVRRPALSPHEERQAVKNALRYFPETLHSELAIEFAQELRDYGHIYMYRLRPRYPLKAYPSEWYPTRTPQAACIIHNIMNNLDP